MNEVIYIYHIISVSRNNLTQRKYYFNINYLKTHFKNLSFHYLLPISLFLLILAKK